MLLFPSASQLLATHVGVTQNSRSMSSRLWSKINSASTAPDGTGGVVWAGDDFTVFDSATNGGWKTAGTAVRQSGITGGVVRATSGTTSGNCGVVGTGDLGLIDGTKLTIFEAYVAMASITTVTSAFVGLAPTAAVAVAGLDAGGLVGSGIGFRNLTGDADAFDEVYQDSTTEVVVTEVAQAIALNTFMKLGLIVDPTAAADERLTYYVDGEPSGTVSQTIIEGTAFPNDAYVGIVIGACTGASASRTIDVDWAAFYQEA